MIGIESVTNAIRTLFTSTLQKPARLVPAIIMLCSLMKRPGLSTIISMGNIAKNLANSGIPTEPLPDGSQNLMLKFANAVTKEIFRALKEDANIQIALPIGGLNIQVTGANAGGPMVAVGTNIAPGTGTGLMH